MGAHKEVAVTLNYQAQDKSHKSAFCSIYVLSLVHGNNLILVGLVFIYELVCICFLATCIF